jgi:hypothetical protein
LLSKPVKAEPQTSTVKAQSQTFFTSTPSTLSSGIRKKKKPQQTRAQKKRLYEKMERAAAVMEQREVKVSKSEVKLKTVRERRKEWEDINGNRRSAKDSMGSRFGVLMDEGDDEHMVVDDPQGIRMEDTQGNNKSEALSGNDTLAANRHEIDSKDDDPDGYDVL